MRSSLTAESIQIKFCTSTPWADIVIRLKQFPIPNYWFRGFEGVDSKHGLFLWLLKLRSHQQQCRSSIVECYKPNDSFDKVDCCFDKV